MKEVAEKGSPNYIIAKLLLNSLPGRFAMSDDQSYHYILDSDSELEEFKNKIGIWNIQGTMDLDNKTLITSSSSLVSDFKTPNINIAVGLAVTAYGRVSMSRVKNNPDIGILYYSDTDSAYTSKPLPKSWLHPTKIGFFKQEEVLTSFVSTGPKIYATVSTSGKAVSKIRGFTGQLTCKELLSLLDTNCSFERTQELCFKDKVNGYLYTSESGYGFKVTDTKRNLKLDGSMVVGTTNKTF